LSFNFALIIYNPLEALPTNDLKELLNGLRSPSPYGNGFKSVMA